MQMQKKRHNINEIIKILREVESGQTVVQVCQIHNISEPCYYRWKQKYGGMEISEAQRLKGIEEENHRLKKKVADLVLENDLLKEVVSKKW
jgi:putative transposase